MKYMDRIKELLNQRAELQAHLNLLPYDGSIEIKEINNKKYLYIRKRILNKVKSTYVGEYSDLLYNQLLNNNIESKAIKRQIKDLNKELLSLGYVDQDLDINVMKNVEFAKANLKQIIYDQAILEGIGTTFIDTEKIIENGKVNNLKAEDVQKIINLKHAWEFILDKDVISTPTDYYLDAYIAKIVNEGILENGGRIRCVPVIIGGSKYVPPLPLESKVIEEINEIINREDDNKNKAIDLCLYCMKKQIFNDGNKRSSVILANHYLISHASGILVIPFDKVDEFKTKLVDYYEDKDLVSVKTFLKECIISI